MAFYLDTSALVKLVVEEADSYALRKWLIETERYVVASDLVRTELMRAVRRAAPDLVVQARSVLDAITLVAMTTAVCEEAGRLDPTTLRSLDALHIATALDLGDDLDAMVTYDERLGSAANSNGIAVIAPGRT